MPKPYKPAATREEYDRFYNKESKSSHEIARMLGVCNNKVLKDLRHFHISVRTRSKAQELAIATGKLIHPTRGKPRSQSTKELIGLNITRNHMKRSEDPAYQEWRTQVAKDRFESLPEESREAFKKNSKRSLIKSSKNGSVLERFLLTSLAANGYNCVPQATILAANENLKIDILLPDWGVAIEVDGITHLEDVYNRPDLFAKKRARDETKNALLIADRYVVIRFGYRKQLSGVKKERLLQKILEILDDLQFGRPAPENALFKIMDTELI